MADTVARLQCSLPTEADILALPTDQRDKHTNASRLKERLAQDAAYCAVRDALGIPYGIQYNPLMPPITDDPEITLIGGRRGRGKGNTLAFWASYFRVRGYDSITNMGLINSWILDDMTDVYALGYLWHNTPVFITEMQTISSTFEGPALKTKALMDFYSMIRKLNTPVTMDTSQPHRVYGQIDTELTWYARPEKTRHGQPIIGRRRYPEFCYQRVKYYGPFPIRYPDIGEKIFEDPEAEDIPRGRWALDHNCGYDAEKVWRASKVNFSWDTIEPGQLSSVDAEAMRGKMNNSAVIEADDTVASRRKQIIMYVIHMLYTSYLRINDKRWTWKHVFQQMANFISDQPMSQYEGYEDYEYETVTWNELEDAMTYEANLNFRGTTYLNLTEFVDRYPGFFESSGNHGDDDND